MQEQVQNPELLADQEHLGVNVQELVHLERLLY